MSNLTRTADYLSDSLEALGFIIMSKKSGEGLPLVAFRLPDVEDGDEDEGRNYDEFALAHQLRVRGWVVPAYTMAPHTERLKMLRVVVREDFTRNRCDALICDIKLSQGVLEQMDRKTIEQQEKFIREHHIASGKSAHNHPKYQVRKPTHAHLAPTTPCGNLSTSSTPGKAGAMGIHTPSISLEKTMFSTNCEIERDTLAPRQDGEDTRHLLREK